MVSQKWAHSSGGRSGVEYRLDDGTLLGVCSRWEAYDSPFQFRASRGDITDLEPGYYLWEGEGQA